MPVRTFVQGRNNFDFEFIVYTFLFARPAHEKITVYCTSDQKNRFKSILKETLFGPTFRDMIHAQFRRFGRESGLALTEHRKFERFLDRLADSKKPFNLYNRLLESHCSVRQIQAEIRDYFESTIGRKEWLKTKTNSRSLSHLAGNYIICAQLKKEMDLFSLSKEKSRDEFIEGLIEFQIFNKQNFVLLESLKGKRRPLKIVQTRPAEFDIYQSDRH
ncbi:MAG: hypothetical protein OEZ51_05550, partial [Nitrospinota bacterium]|nr:hypothetical protein [Nitrospinota bacterium]